MFVVADDLVGGAAVLHLKVRAAPADLQQFIAETRSPRATHAGESFAQRPDHRHGQRFPGHLCHFACQAIRFRVFNAQCHNVVYIGRYASILAFPVAQC